MLSKHWHVLVYPSLYLVSLLYILIYSTILIMDISSENSLLSLMEDIKLYVIQYLASRILYYWGPCISSWHELWWHRHSLFVFLSLYLHGLEKRYLQNSSSAGLWKALGIVENFFHRKKWSNMLFQCLFCCRGNTYTFCFNNVYLAILATIKSQILRREPLKEHLG